MTLQEQVTSTKKNHLLKAAARTFAEKGFHATSIKDVARAAGVADGTIYNYFPSKHALLLGLFAQMTQAAAQAVNPADLLASDLRSFLKLFLTQPLNALHGNDSELLRVVLSEALVNRELAAAFRREVLAPMMGGAVAFVRAWFNERGEAWVEPEAVVRLLSSLVLGLLIQAALGDETLEQNWDTLPDTLTELLMRGLS